MKPKKENLVEEIFNNPAPDPGLPDETKIPRIVSGRIPCSNDDLRDHLEKYVQMLLDEVADEALIIRAKDIPQDPRVLLKCSHPKCPAYGRSGSCPPHVKGDFETAKQNLRAYDWAIVYRVFLPKEGLHYLTSPSQIEALRTKEYYHASGSSLRYVYGRGDVVERAAFYDGHYYAINLHFGPCLSEYCEKFKNCQEIKAGVCRFPFKSKPSVEQTFGIDFLKLAAQLGWEYHMLGPCAFLQDFPQEYQPYFIGLALIE